ncbi:MAG TPA: hypothetical protein VF846_11835 [Thermoanaerobaculia bacterium]
MYRSAALLILMPLALLGCGGDDGPTAPPANICAQNWAGSRTFVIRGGCEGVAFGDEPGGGVATFNSCTLNLDVTPKAEKNRGGTWMLSANLQAGTATVVRTNGTCPGTESGELRFTNASITTSLRAAANPACDCRLSYTISIARPL